MNWNGRTIVLGILLLTLFFSAGLDRPAPAQTSDTHLTGGSGSATAAQPFDVKAAVDAYLASVPAAQRARSNAYFEGGYWLLLWDFLESLRNWGGQGGPAQERHEQYGDSHHAPRLGGVTWRPSPV